MNYKDFEGIEATYLDYKVSLEKEKPKSWLKSISAFANTKGGHILFGFVDSTHEAIGLDDAQETAHKISEFISARIVPPVQYILIPFESAVKGRLCLDLHITNGPHYPYYYVHDHNRECYIRRGDRSELATPLEQNNLILKGMNQTFDALPSIYQLKDVSFTLLGATYKKETGDNFDMEKDLISMGFVMPQGTVSNAGLLLCDQGYLKQSRIVCTRWKGIEKGAIDGDALDDEEFNGASLITLLNSAEGFIRNNSKNPWTIRGMRREENSDYPFKAVREVLVNALIHRDYQNTGAEVHVDMYDDRMEISSPGGMMNGSRIQDLDLKKVPSMRRNEIISDIFSRLHYMDKRGSGIRRILNSYADFIEKPEFYSNEYFFFVTLPNRGEANRIIDESSSKKPLSQERMQLSQEKTQLSQERTQLSQEKTQLSPKEREQIELQKWLLEKNAGNFKPFLVEKLLQLLINYTFQYSFNRHIVANSFQISDNAASRIIKKALECGIMRKEKRGVYYFNRQE